MTKTELELAAEKAAKEKKEADKAAADLKLAEDKAEADKIAAEKAAKEKSNLKKEYTVCVTGFYAFGKMFRSGAKISGKQYKDVIPQWIKEGKIK